MTLIRPSPVENLINSLWGLEPDRPKYYIFVCRQARNIFQIMDKPEKVVEMERIKKTYVEIPLSSHFVAVVHAFDKFRYSMPKRAYVKIGDILNHKEITIYEIEQRLEAVKDWVYDEVAELSQYVRFTNQQPVLA